MFNLIVKSSAWVSGTDRFSTVRMFEYTDAMLDARFRPNSLPDLIALKALPTVFMEETYPPNNQIARVGHIIHAYPSGKEVVLDYVLDPSIPPISNLHFQTFAAELGIEPFEFSRTHWAVKDTDLFRSLLRNMQPRQSKPTVFTIADPEAIEPTLVSAMMPFAASFTPVYETMKTAAEAAGLHCRRADDIWENPSVMQDVVSLIDKSKIVIADCTGRNPNVFYEAGIAHALGREVILITQTSEDIPFDLRHLRYALYLNNGEGREALGVKLKSRFDSLVSP